MMMLFVVLAAVGVPVIVAEGLPELNTRGLGSAAEDGSWEKV